MNTLQRIFLLVTLFCLLTIWHGATPVSFAQTSGSSTRHTQEHAQSETSPAGHGPDSRGALDDGYLDQQQAMASGYSSFQKTTGHFTRQQERIVVIPTSVALMPNIPDVHEDMSVMSHILLRSLDRSALSTLEVRRGFTDFGEFFRQDQDMEAIFLEDYGALFMITVDFPLSASEKNKTGMGPPESQVDTTWEQARQEISSPDTYRRDRRLSHAPGYDADRIALIKTGLIKTLKYASHIRHLSADAWIVVRLSNSAGTSSFSSQIMMGSVSAGGGRGFGGGGMAGAGGGFGGGMGGVSYGGGAGALKPAQATSLCLRVLKSEVDAFAEGSLDSKAFQNKVKIMTY